MKSLVVQSKNGIGPLPSAQDVVHPLTETEPEFSELETYKVLSVLSFALLSATYSGDVVAMAVRTASRECEKAYGISEERGLKIMKKAIAIRKEKMARNPMSCMFDTEVEL